MDATEKEIYRYLKTHAPTTLKKLKENLKAEPLDLYRCLWTLYEKGEVEHISFPIDGNLDPDFSRKYTIKKKA